MGALCQRNENNVKTTETHTMIQCHGLVHVHDMPPATLNVWHRHAQHTPSCTHHVADFILN